ncbi:hypothetical protein ADICYQ_4336 [Cyclobacterium qasimii M12-11B]|uniref:Uncharacterized protein n=1 Tax=Cyclobacterium qasimii M12-11B TaxID=641524 RepID=S7WIM1_9BACT|nr:hypothetical protein ADICYQ_4336 [Cyclobacterium qasimii M12-11B]
MPHPSPIQPNPKGFAMTVMINIFICFIVNPRPEGSEQ